MAEAGVDFPLIHGSAEEIQLPDASFDIVFSDHGALSWADPHVVVPEVARVLCSGGILAVNVSSPLLCICYDEETETTDSALHRSYFELGIAAEDGGAATYELTDGDWIRLLRANGLSVEALFELRPPDGATTTYGGYVSPSGPRSGPASICGRRERHERAQHRGLDPRRTRTTRTRAPRQAWMKDEIDWGIWGVPESRSSEHFRTCPGGTWSSLAAGRRISAPG